MGGIQFCDAVKRLGYVVPGAWLVANPVFQVVTKSSAGVPPVQPPATDADLTSIRWNAEEAVRDIEKALALMGQARQRLLNNVIDPLVVAGH